MIFVALVLLVLATLSHVTYTYNRVIIRHVKHPKISLFAIRHLKDKVKSAQFLLSSC